MSEQSVFDSVFKALGHSRQELRARNTENLLHAARRPATATAIASVNTVQMLCWDNIQWEASHEPRHAQ